MSKTKPGMPSPALTEDDVRRLIREEIKLVREEINACLSDMNTAISYMSNWDLTMDVIQLSMRKDTSEDQEASEYTQEGWVDESFQDSVTAD